MNWIIGFIQQAQHTPFGAFGFVFQMAVLYGVTDQIRLNFKSKTIGLATKPYFYTLLASICYGINSRFEVPNPAMFWPQVVSVVLAVIVLWQIVHFRHFRRVAIENADSPKLRDAA